MLGQIKKLKYRKIIISGLGMLLLTHLLILYTQFLLAGGRPGHFYYPWDAPFWMLIVCGISILITFVIHQKTQHPQKPASRYVQTLLVSTLLFMLISNTWFITTENIIFGKPMNYNALIVGNLLFLIIHLVVGNTFLSYYSLNKLHQTQVTLLETQKVASEHQLEQLKKQISPHFLFNNLNVLSSLIHTNTDTADVFLDKFSGLYRYILQSRDQELVSLAKELNFLEDYMFLIRQRFDNSYLLNIANHITQPEQYLVIPTTLQQLIENAIKHNEALPDKPLKINISINQNEAQISNVLKPKKFPLPSTKTGLVNIQKQYQLLTQKNVQVHQTSEQFLVIVPLIKLNTNL
ncbi:hypothetical protein BKI52_07595 [marine bacterium AO1-C]|nr:hypothetical protein BKI52_07595 [marine bacterium AO1-C]